MKQTIQIFALLGMLALFTACQQSTPYQRTAAWLGSMEHSLVPAKNRNDYGLASIKKEVKKNGNSREGRERIKRAEELNKKSVEMLGDLDKLKSHLVRKAGQGLDSKTYTVKKPMDKSRTAAIMKTEAPKFSKKLNKYSQWLNDEFKDLGMYKFNALGDGLADQSFYQSYFKEATVLEALLTLTRYQAVVLRYEASVLKKFGAEF